MLRFILAKYEPVASHGDPFCLTFVVLCKSDLLSVKTTDLLPAQAADQLSVRTADPVPVNIIHTKCE